MAGRRGSKEAPTESSNSPYGPTRPSRTLPKHRNMSDEMKTDKTGEPGHIYLHIIPRSINDIVPRVLCIEPLMEVGYRTRTLGHWHVN